MDTYEVEPHPFGPCMHPDTEYLIVGTFPTHRKNFKYRFFYSGKENLFWNVLSEVFSETFRFQEGEVAVTERSNFLERQRIGLMDMHSKCYRLNERSGDEYLFPIVLTDLFDILRRYKKIHTIIPTSRTEVVGALGLIKTYFTQREKEFPEIKKREDKIWETSFENEGKIYKIIVPYSCSRRTIKEGRTTKEELVEMYKYSFL